MFSRRNQNPCNCCRCTDFAASPQQLQETVFRHFSGRAIEELRPRKQNSRADVKPGGLWISPEGYYNWEAWTDEEGFCTNSGEFVYRITLKPEARICWLNTAREIEEFTLRYGTDDEFKEFGPPPPVTIAGKKYYVESGSTIVNLKSIYWQLVAREYQGIVIAPYEKLVKEAKINNNWLLAWDASTGCIWDPEAVKEIVEERSDISREEF